MVAPSASLPTNAAQEEDEMSSRAATRKLGAILASMVVSSFAVFGHDAWAPEPAQISGALGASTGATAAAAYVNTLEPLRATRIGQALFAHQPPCRLCHQLDHRAVRRQRPLHPHHMGHRGGAADSEPVGHRQHGVRDDPLDGGGHHRRPEAGNVVGMTIVRSGNYAKCSS